MRSYEFSKAWQIKKAKRIAHENKKWESKSGPVVIRYMTEEERKQREGQEEKHS